MTNRMCPKTSAECEHLASCNNIDACNMPIPIKEFIAQSSENAVLIAKLMDDLKTGKAFLS